MANFTSIHFHEALAKKQIHLETDTLLMLLVGEDCTATEANKYLTDVDDLDELTGGGYTRVTLSNKLIVTDAVNLKVYLTGDPASWAVLGSSLPIGGAIICANGPSGDASHLIIARYDENFPIPPPLGGPVILHPSATDGYVLIKKGV